ncbi:MAG: hypothetical protein R2797_02480 [Gelidibacter sp.]
MKSIKVLSSFLFILLAFNVNAQKIKIKKDVAQVDGVEYLKIEKINPTKYFVSTLDGNEILSINLESFGTGKYNQGYGPRTEIMHWYSEIKFLNNEEIGDVFEVDEGRLKNIVEMFYNSNIIVDGQLSTENAKRMIEKYSENVSERRFLTKN